MKGCLYFNLEYQNAFVLDYYHITCNDYNNITNMLCYGTNEGSLIFSCTRLIHDSNEIKFTNRNITDVPIYNVNWLDDTRIGVSFADSMFVIFDVQSDKIISYEDDSGTVRYIKKYNDKIFYTCGRNKCASAWDIRTMDRIKTLEHENTVTCVEFHTTNKNLIYTTSTPGTIVHYWDLRYTKNGKNYATKKTISNSFCRELFFYKNNLYSKNIISSLHKISQTAKYKNILFKYNSPSYCGSISYNERYDCLLTSVGDDVYCINNKECKKNRINVPNDTIGCVSYSDHSLLLNNAQNVFLYKLNPEIN
ncbi:WD40 repeat domain-containing protein [Vairimorpha necatrix]|uniref:WD40 repeat domain-containing protein n=1 Tax=Vairimorpha necatrix TaxID=6039 RepID=A0AAX4JFX4_9MICR